MTAAVRAHLRSDVPTVLVEAPAGCGKTYEAAELAFDMLEDLSDGQSVLLLAHTNAAKEEFTRRTKAARSRIVVSTIDSFSAHILSHYTSAFDLPSPLERNLGTRGAQVPFADLSRHALNLLRRAPTIARLLSFKYPLIIGDEHQDASTTQHRLVTTLAQASSSRLRLLADPMQAIFDGEDSVPWAVINSSSDITCALSVPMRWRANRPLGDWILSARAELQAGRPLLLADAPDTVRIVRCDRSNGDQHHHKDVRTISGPALQFIDNAGDQTFSILTYPNASTTTIEKAVHRRGIRVNEGADYERAYSLLDTAINVAGDPQETAVALLKYILSVSVGLSGVDQTRIRSMLGERSLISPPRGRLSAFTPVFSPIYGDEPLYGFFRGCQAVLDLNLANFRLTARLTLLLLSSLSKYSPDAVQDELSAVIGARKATAQKPARTVSTIHKSKGLEFDHVLIAYCGRNHFPDNEQARRRLYVAVSRATETLTLHVPNAAPSPLISI